MGREKSIVVSVRLPASVKTTLEAQSEVEGITVNALISKMIIKHAQWDKFAADIGFASVTKPFLRSVLEQIDEKSLNNIAVSTCRSAMRDAMIYLAGELSIEAFVKAADLWLSAAYVPFRHVRNNGTDR
jgi:hypothetical protein